MSSYCTSCGASLGESFAYCGQCGVRLRRNEEPGNVDGKHYTEYVDSVKGLMRADDLEGAERLLLRLVAAVEAEFASKGFGLAPWYYERLGVLYRKRKDFGGEVAILERFASLVKGTTYADYFQARLTKARLLRDKA